MTCDPKGFVDGLNLYAFVLNDPLIKYDLYGFYANPWMFPRSEFSNNAFKGRMSGAWNFATKSLTSLAGQNDDFIHWIQAKEYQ